MIPAGFMGDPGRLPGSWLQPGLAPAVASIWEVSESMGDLNLCLSNKMKINFLKEHQKMNKKNAILTLLAKVQRGCGMDGNAGSAFISWSCGRTELMRRLS